MGGISTVFNYGWVTYYVGAGFEFHRTPKQEIAPSTPTPAQQTIPTSAYGQTIPVIYAKARVPSAYIWAAPIDVDIDGDAVSVKLTARLRFARPLVADSTWAIRRMWASGNLILDRTTGYRSPNLITLAAYDGRSTQGRDPLMVAEEGEDEVSAHRGYLDAVVVMELGSRANQPPAFDAEWIQDAETGVLEESFAAFTSEEINTTPSVNWSTGRFYGLSTSSRTIRWFSVPGLQEIYAIPFTELVNAYSFFAEECFRYVPQTNRIYAIAATAAGAFPWYGIIINPMTGAVEYESADGLQGGANDVSEVICHIRFDNASVFIGAMFLRNVYTMRFSASGVARTYFSDTDWEGYTSIQCMAPGTVTGDTADVWVCAGTDLVKVRVSSSGAVLSATVHATFADDLRYCVFYGGDVIVWNDAAQAIKVDGTTGTTIWTDTVPYQIGVATLRDLGPPDMHRFTAGKFYFQEATAYNFTDLETGETQSIAKGSSSVFNYVYDSVNDQVVYTDNAAEPVRIRFDGVGDGTIRDLEDFFAALTEYGEGFANTEHEEINITDQIQGAVIDATSGIREVARSTAAPYSIAIFERAGKIIYKRALTDGSFAVDATLSTNDFVDRGGQAIKARRFNPEEFIARYGINYRDPDEIYQARPQFGEIQFTPFPLSPTDLSIKADIPIIASGTVIKTLATKKVNRLAEERHEFTFGLKAKYFDLEPEDVIRFTYAGRTVTARVLETTMNPDFTIEVKCTEFLSAVAATVAGAVGRPVEPGEVGQPESEYYHLDIPLQSDADDLESGGLVQYHVLTSQGQDNWDGAMLYRQVAGYVPISAQTDDGLVGVAHTALPDCELSPYVTEFTRTLVVSFITGDTSQLATKTYLEVMNGANRFAIGAPGRWEICHVITITDEGDGTFTFEGFVRGRGVSEEHTASHQAGDFVVWLSGDNVQHVDYALSDLNDAFNYKAVGFGGNVTTTPSVSRTVTGEAEKIPKPAQLNVVRDGTKLVISWVRRGRISPLWDDDGIFTTPLGETLEQYVIRVLDGPGGTQVRSFTVDDATEVDYPDADQTTDFGSTIDPGESITVTARQVSGTGVICPTREATITLS